MSRSGTRPLNIGVYGARGIPSTYSGYETFLTTLLPELADRGHQVTAYCRRGHIKDGAPYKGVRRVVLPSLGSKQLDTLSHGFIATIAARLSGHDVVFVVNVANALPCLVARLLRERVVLNTDGQEWLRGKWSWLGKKYFWVSARIAGKCASALVSDSNAMREIYLEDFRADSTVIPYCWEGIDEAPGSTVSKNAGVTPTNYFLVAARLNPENNVERVVSAYLEASVDSPLLVLGKANYGSPSTRAIEEIAKKNAKVVMAGHVSDRRQFASLLKHARCYIHTHSVGGINPSLIEAMGAGARVLALSTPFNREALGNAGEFFDDFRQELPQALETIEREDLEKSEVLRRAARERARTYFSLGSIADSYEALFSAVAARRSWDNSVLSTPWMEKPLTLGPGERRPESKRATDSQ